ncbi:MAG: hypothetical protein M3M85_02880 [bacterium]|nr:hypothetical protein [bacterium]
MTKIFRGLKVIGLAILVLAVSVGAGSALAGLTFDESSVESSSGLTLNGAVASNITLAGATTTGNIVVGGAQTSGAITIGGGVQTGTITLGGGTGAQIVNVGTGGTGIKTINIGTSSVANVLTMGTENGAASTELRYGDGGLIVSPTSDTTLVDDELAFLLVEIDGGAATEVESFPGITQNAIVVCAPNTLTNNVTLYKATPAADQITFTFSLDPGASMLSCMIQNYAPPVE